MRAHGFVVQQICNLSHLRMEEICNYFQLHKNNTGRSASNLVVLYNITNPGSHVLSKSDAQSSYS